MPKIEIEVRKVGSTETWKEQYTIDSEPHTWAKNVIDNFNNTLREGEGKRELVDVVVLDESEHLRKHIWRKENVVTIIRGSKSYDKYKCEKCGITGKRFGLGIAIQRDSKYKAKKYEKCV